jgi:catechol 2,3-dioxygenase-like lactoylglutathione lyase family enzyme
MKKTAFIILGIVASFCFGFFFNTIFNSQHSNIESKQTKDYMKIEKVSNMKLGAFSVSLSVKDIKASKQFYENLGFEVFGGSLEQDYLIMKNEKTLIGLFQGMFEGNMLTFNPGWDENAKNMEKFDDIREIQRHLKSKGITINPEADENTSGPASFMVTDPDRNVLLFDQHR